MDHGLFVARLIVTEVRHLLQGLADARDIAMSKDAKAASEKCLLNTIALYVLILEKGDNSLSHRSLFGCHVIHILSPSSIRTSPCSESSVGAD
jgi:hypothetical protein